ncbi:MAG: hypothetical protein AAGE94_17695 [Acidobacteriota bacterium]
MSTLPTLLGPMYQDDPDPGDPATGGGSDPKSPLDKPGDDHVLTIEED